MTTRRSSSGALRFTHPRSTIALIELDVVGRLTPCSDARSVSMRGRTLSIERRPNCAGAGSSPAARSSAATVRITSGTISRISRAVSRAWSRVICLGVLSIIQPLPPGSRGGFLDSRKAGVYHAWSRRATRRVSVVGFVPKEMFFTKGVGKHREKLTSFELALRSAGIAACNLVRVSSIFPPGCRILSRAQGAKRLEPGQVTFVVMSEAATREPHRLIAATVGVAIPRNRDLYGYLSEHHSFGESEEVAGDYAEELAAEMLATTLGLEFDPDRSWDENKEVYRLSNQIVRTQNVTQTAVGDKKGLWTTVVAAAVLVG